MSELLPVPFGGLLRSLRTAAGLTQEELAEAARVSYRSVSDLERGVSRFPRRETARLLADALGLSGDDRARFEVAARGRRPAAGNDASGALPRDIASFTGREPETEAMLTAVMGAGAAGVVDICAIDGMAGIGKTAFAVHVAHQLVDRFPDGQVFLQLHGHTPGRQPVDPADALASLLQASGILACLDDVTRTGQHARVIASPLVLPGSCTATARSQTPYAPHSRSPGRTARR